MPSRAIGALTPNLSLLYHRNVRPIDIYLARLILEGAGATMSFVFLVLFFSFVGWLQLPEDVLQVTGGWLMLAWFGSSLALFLGALSETSETVEKLWHPAAYILFPLSGAAFLVDALPEAGPEVRVATANGARRGVRARGVLRVAGYRPLRPRLYGTVEHRLDAIRSRSGPEGQQNRGA